MTFRAYALTIAGCPYVFTDTPGLPSLTSSSALWPSPSTVAAGYLVRPTNTWTERAKPLDGDLETDSQRFTLHDAKSGSTHLLTWLATRDPIHVTSSPLAAAMTAADMSFTVGDDSIYSFPQVVWIDGEAILCASSAANVVTVTTRGYYGTKAVAHAAYEPSQFPEVFAEMPWITRRKVCLWAVDSTGVCTLLWAGYAVRAPVLSEDGARFDLPCDSLWTVQKQCPVGGGIGQARAVGYGRSGVSADSRTGSTNSLLQSVWAVTYSGTVRRFIVTSLGPFREWGPLARDHEARATAMSTSRAARIDIHIGPRTGTSARADADVLTATVPAFTLGVVFAGREVAPVLSTATGVRQTVTREIIDIPQTLHILNAVASVKIPVNTMGALPTTWSTTTTTDDTYTTTETPALRCDYSEDWSLLIEGVTLTDDGSDLAPYIEGTTTLRARKPGLTETEAPAIVMLSNPPPLQAVYHVRAGHWHYGLRRSVVGLCEDAHTNDWDWTDIATVARVTAGLRTARDWVFDGKRTLGSVVTECCLLHGCSPVLRSGRLALHAWAWSDAHTTPAVSLTKTEIIGLPTWQRWQEGLANRLQVKSTELTLDASQAQSRARYGPGRNISIDLAGLDEQAFPVDDPFDFMRTILGRLELWSEPLGMVRLTVSAAYLASLELGDELVVTEWMLPDGTGARGLAAVRGFVVSRTVDLGKATLTVEAIVFLRRSYPYAPAARVSSQISTTIVECAAAGYVNGASSYSGTNDTTTFTVGDKVDIISREFTSTADAGQTISAINTTTRRITFASPMSAGIQARIAAGAIVDVVFADFATPVVAAQENWMFVGDDTTAVIDGTATPARHIAP